MPTADTTPSLLSRFWSRRMTPRSRLQTARGTLGVLGVWWLLVALGAALGNSTMGVLHDADSVKGIGWLMLLLALATFALAWYMGTLRRAASYGTIAVLVLAILLTAQRPDAINLLCALAAAAATALVLTLPAEYFRRLVPVDEVAPVPVATVLRRIDRIRGTGWLDCPNCHEHAAQDVVDEMYFVALFFYRFGVIRRRRVMVCRRCSYRRNLTIEELKRLDTGGEPIRPAVLWPVGLTGVALVVGFAVFLTSRAAAGAAASIVFLDYGPQNVAPITWKVPASWDHSADANPDPPDVPHITVRETNGVIELDRLATEGNDLYTLYVNHYGDQHNPIEDRGFPTAPPKPDQVTLAGQKALHSSFTFEGPGGAQTKISFYAFIHDGVGYTLTYYGAGPEIKTFFDSGGVEQVVNDSLKFTNKTETPAPCTTPVPSPSPGATPPPAAPPSSAAPGATPLPTCPAIITPAAATGSASASGSSSGSASPSG